MELMKCKTMLAMLWMIQAVNFAAVVFYGFFEQLDSRELGITLYLFIPCLMAWLSLALNGSVNRWLSLILGILAALVKLRYIITGFDSVGFAFRFNEVWGFLGAILIVWYAWKWPKEEP